MIVSDMRDLRLFCPHHEPYKSFLEIPGFEDDIAVKEALDFINTGNVTWKWGLFGKALAAANHQSPGFGTHLYCQNCGSEENMLKLDTNALMNDPILENNDELRRRPIKRRSSIHEQTVVKKIRKKPDVWEMSFKNVPKDKYEELCDRFPLALIEYIRTEYQVKMQDSDTELDSELDVLDYVDSLYAKL
jgi:hypothetical protein